MGHATADCPIQGGAVGASLAAGYDLARDSSFHRDSHTGARSGSSSALSRKVWIQLEGALQALFRLVQMPKP